MLLLSIYIHKSGLVEVSQRCLLLMLIITTITGGNCNFESSRRGEREHKKLHYISATLIIKGTAEVCYDSKVESVLLLLQRKSGQTIAA